MRSEPTIVYFYYDTDTVPYIRNAERFTKQLNAIICKKLSFIHTTDIRLLPVPALTSELDLLLVIKSDTSPLDTGVHADIGQELARLVRLDQDARVKYRVSVSIESNPADPFVRTAAPQDPPAGDEETDYKKRAEAFVAEDPDYTFDRVILSPDIIERIEDALGLVQCRKKVFEEWGLHVIEKHPSSALNFYGPSGTGKSMAAEAVASKLGKKIIRASYADLESKFVGEGPKKIKSIFYAAEMQDAVLFIDEADSLLSKRLTNVQSGHDQAINSMRSDLLISLERFSGIVIFATNLVGNYDPAFLTRLIDIAFTLPDASCRKRIWDVHLYPTSTNSELKIPLADDVDTAALADKYEGFCGRDIRNAVINTCVHVARTGGDVVTQADLIDACDKLVIENEKLEKAQQENEPTAKPAQLTPELAQKIGEKVLDTLPDKEPEENAAPTDVGEQPPQ